MTAESRHRTDSSANNQRKRLTSTYRQPARSVRIGCVAKKTSAVVLALVALMTIVPPRTRSRTTEQLTTKQRHTPRQRHRFRHRTKPLLSFRSRQMCRHLSLTCSSSAFASGHGSDISTIVS